ncbi:MAG: HYR domain-containing protein, partial [Saprospiraceae bacterium]|nr:HYR domain-containing protein [Saprospiraceae bacterium]
MIRNILLLSFLCLAIAAQAQYSEPFSVANKGYKVSCVNDLTAVNWSLSAWDASGSCQPADLRDPSDYFNTTAAGKMESIDTDQEVYWESPLINTVAANPVSIKMDLSWVGFDTDVMANNCSTDYIKVEYSVNGGAYVMIPNVAGGNACATVAYPFQNPGGQFDGNVSINHGGVAGGSTLKIRVKVNTNANLELVTIDNVEVPEAGVFVGCAAPTLSTVITQVGCSNPNSGAIDLTVSAGTPPYTYSWTGGATTQDLSNKPAGTYTVTVTDAASCTATISATITAAPALSLTTQVLDASCTGNMDGEIDLAVTGGVPAYTYSWTGGATTQDRAGLGTGTYTVTVTDATGCTATKSATVGVLPSGAYNEQFNIANKGYLANWVDDFAGVNWTMSGWTKEPPALFGRDMADFFRTSGGVLYGEDFDQEICWESPLIDLNGGTQFSVDLAWTGFDNQTDEYINVKYSIDGGGYVTIPNVVGGGTGTIQYASGLDHNGSTTVTKTGLSGGTIQIQVCGQFNSNNESMTIDNVNIPGSNNYCPAPEPSLTGTNVSCNGGANGTITTTVTNGTAPYTYAWSDGGVTTQNRTGLAAGTYTVTVTDANMATGTASIIITQPTAIVLTETHVNVLCNGASTGSIDLTVSGGTPAYTYSWTGGVTTQDRSGLAAGTYTVTVTDSKECTKTLSVTITQPAALSLTETHVNVACNGQSNGSIDLTVTGGTGAYTYSWNGGATTQDRSGLAAGTYTVTVTDANACTKTLSTTITQPNSISVSVVRVKVPCRGEATGGLNITVTGGTPGYTFDWSNNGPQNPDTDPEDLMNVVAGYYYVSITDANGCLAVFADTVTQPATLLALSTTQVNVQCQGGSTGSIDLTVTGGGSPYTYSWTGGATTQDRSGLAAGTYTVTVTDANNCVKTISATITEPATGIALTETHVNVLCNGGTTGSIDLIVSGGVSPYTYSWTGGVTTQDRSGLAAGTYTVTVTDANACTKTLSATITQPTAIALTETHVNVACNGGSNGTIDLTVTGGTGAYTYSWTGGVTTQDRSGLVAGTYTVTVTDANACTKTLSATITEPTIIVLTETHVNALCNGGSTGSIDLTVSGGVSPYTYSWTGGATTQDRSGLAAGTYTVTVTDANACTKTLSATITEPSAGITLIETHVNVLCNGYSTGSIDLTPSGGTIPYTYSWTGGATTQDHLNLAAGTYTVTVTDMNGCTKTLSATITEPTAIILTETHVNAHCNGSSTGSIDLIVSGGTGAYTYSWTGGVTTQDRSGLAAGTYTVTVTDANACTKTLSTTITEPTTIVLTETHVNVLCNGNSTGSIDLAPSGGTGAYTYSWTGGATTQDRSGLAAGTYTVTVTDANACTKTLSTTITEASAVVLAETHVNVLCNGNSTGSIDLTVSGGVSPYTYSWTGGVTTQDRSGLAAGTYTVTVTDANACTKTLSATITEATVVVLTETHVNVLCNGSSTGSIDLTESGGVSPYTYSWTGGVTTQDRSGLAAGTYTVTVTDANACTKILSATITQPTVIALSTTQMNVLCNGNSTGSIDLTVSGGTGAYTYSWTGGVTTQDRSGLAAGTYTVTVTDANACTKTLSATITQPATIVLTETHVDVLCNGALTGSIDLTVSGGVSPYTYFWTGGATTQDRSGLGFGTYTVTVTDANACTKTLSVSITETSPLVLTETHVNVLCNGNSTGSIDLSVSGGSSPYAYAWTGGATTQDRSGLVAGTYTVTLTDANNCTKTLSATITEPTLVVLSTTQVNVLCNGSSTGSIDLTVSGGVSPYTYSWTGGATSQDVSGLAAGTYTVTVTDANACTKTSSVTITQPTVIVLSAILTQPTNCFVANGSIDLSVSGGVPGYTYSWTGGTTAQDLLNVVEATYTVTVTDANGCTKTSSYTLDYIDIINPMISCPGNINVNNSPASACSAVVNYTTPTATDNCGILSVVLQSGLASGASYPVGTTTNVWRATDLSNNTATCAFSVTVTDVTLPTITCPASISVGNSPASACSAVVNYATPTATDNCGIQSVTLQSGLASGATFPVGTTTNIWRTTDVNNNTSTCSFTVTVNDVTPPTVTCKNYTADLDASGNVSIVPANVLLSGSDNCGTVNYAVNPNSFNCSNVGTNTVTLTARDAAFNTATCTATVTVRDVTPPVARCKTGIINADLGPNGTVTVLPSAVNNGSTDNCSMTFTVMPNPFNCSQIGLQIVTLKATDPGGNMSTCTATVRVRDVTGPMALCKTTTVFLDDNGIATITPEAVNDGSSDNCGIATMSVFPNNFDCSQINGTPVPVTLSVRDNQGYESSCTGYVIVKDNIAPTAICEDVTVILPNSGPAVVHTLPLTDESTDNCAVWPPYTSPQVKLYYT